MPYISEIKIGGTTNPGVVPQVQATVAEAVPAYGRDPAGIGLVVGAVTVVDRDRAAARQLARREAALYISITAQLDHSLGLEPELLQRINAASARYDYEEVGRCLSDELLRRLAFAGTPDEAAQQAADLFAAGVNRVEFGTPHGLDPVEGMRLLGEQVLPALKESRR